MFIQEVLNGLSEIYTALTLDPGIWWLLAPLILLWVAMEIYFGEYKQEQLGFSSTLANGLTLFWISLTSFRTFLFIDQQYINKEAYQDVRLYLLAFFVLYALIIMYISFTHAFRARITQIFAGPSTIYFFSILSVLWGGRLLEASPRVAYALVILFSIIIVVFFLVRRQLGLRGDVERIHQLAEEHANNK